MLRVNYTDFILPERPASYIVYARGRVDAGYTGE